MPDLLVVNDRAKHKLRFVIARSCKCQDLFAVLPARCSLRPCLVYIESKLGVRGPWRRLDYLPSNIVKPHLERSPRLLPCNNNKCDDEVGPLSNLLKNGSFIIRAKAAQSIRMVSAGKRSKSRPHVSLRTLFRLQDLVDWQLLQYHC